MLNFTRGDHENEADGLVLESADGGWSTATGKKNKKKGKNNKSSDKEGSDKENVVMTQSEVRIRSGISTIYYFLFIFLLGCVMRTPSTVTAIFFCRIRYFYECPL